MTCGYRLSNKLLDEAFSEYLKLNLSKIYTFQQYIEAMYGPTIYLKNYFEKNNLSFDENLNITKDIKFDILNSYYSE
jgi:hypothetical protein